MSSTKYIREIAEKLPVVYEQTVSGFFLVDGQPQPNLVNHPINHVRRMRKAYKDLGIEGIKKYLEYIHKLQIERNVRVQNLKDAEGEEVSVGDSLPSSGD